MGLDNMTLTHARSFMLTYSSKTKHGNYLIGLARESVYFNRRTTDFG